MIISIEEFKELGFNVDAQNEALLEGCIKRAEYILNALCGGVLASAMAQSKTNASLIKQAAAFQADALMKSEYGGNLKSVSLGDMSYTESGDSNMPDITQTVRRLLRAAGCFPYAAAEVVE